MKIRDTLAMGMTKLYFDLLLIHFLHKDTDIEQ